MPFFTAHFHISRLQFAALGFICFMMLTLNSPVTATSEPAMHPAVAESFELLRSGQHRQAIKVCGKAKKLEGESKAQCALATAIAHSFLGDHKRTAEAAQQAVDISQDEAVLHRAHTELGNALVGELEFGKEPKKRKLQGTARQEALQRAVNAFRQATALSPDDVTSRTSLAKTLLSQMLYYPANTPKEAESNEDRRSRMKQDYERRGQQYTELKSLLEPMLDAGQLGELTPWAEAITCRDDRYTGVSFGFDAPSKEAPGAPANPNDSESPATAAISSKDEVIHVSDGVSRPEKLNAPAPVYSEVARKARVQGVVIVQAIIDKQGHIAALRPLRGLPLCLTEEALLAIKDWKFRPATLDGRPVDVYYNLTVNYRLQ